ncbi:hypothetical protein [Frankia nepalensis]|uniref:hypothetical protein n=1 Tax=Frankia nepalensis TaxID=1836974 RepID=UPI001EE3BB1F|nr:hypothetical protein [Frankia nepalensis]
MGVDENAPPAAPAAPVAVTEPEAVTRITPLGLGLLATAVALAAGTAVLRYAELAALAAAAFAALLIAALAVARRPRPRATLRVSPGAVPRGEAAVLVVEIHNPSRRPSPPVRLEIPWGHGPRLPWGQGPGVPRGRGPARSLINI